MNWQQAKMRLWIGHKAWRGIKRFDNTTAAEADKVERIYKRMSDAMTDIIERENDVDSREVSDLAWKSVNYEKGV